jgi:hypothetical protein
MRDNTIRVRGRHNARSRKIKIHSVKELLTKAGFNEKQVTQAFDIHHKWRKKIAAIVGAEWDAAIVGVQFEGGELRVQVAGAAQAARVRLALASALAASQLALPADGATARKLKVSVAR